MVESAGGKLKEGEVKVEECVRVIDASIVEKDAALLRVQHLTSEYASSLSEDAVLNVKCCEKSLLITIEQLV